MRLAIIISHPIQYYAPVFKKLASHITLKVFYTAQHQSVDPGFQHAVVWDIPLLEGYAYQFASGVRTIPAVTTFNPSHLLVYSWSPRGHLGILMHFKNKVHIMFRGDSTLLKTQPLWKKMLKPLFLKKIYSYVDTALYVGSRNKAYFLKYGLKEHQLVFAPHAIDNSRFNQPTTSRSFRESLGLSDHDTLVLFSGKFTRNKNPLLLVKAFKKVAQPATHLLLVGGGELAPKLHREAEGNANIHIWPFQNQGAIPIFYQAYDLFCLPSKNESWGLAINEAMACGKAVLVSEQCGAAADLVHRDNGRTFKSDDVHDLQQKLAHYLAHPSLLKLAGLSSQRYIKEWSFEVQVDNILKALQA